MPLLSGRATGAPPVGVRGEFTRTVTARVKAARKANAASKNFKDKQIAEAEHVREHIMEHRDAVRTE